MSFFSYWDNTHSTTAYSLWAVGKFVLSYSDLLQSVMNSLMDVWSSFDPADNTQHGNYHHLSDYCELFISQKSPNFLYISLFISLVALIGLSFLTSNSLQPLCQISPERSIIHLISPLCWLKYKKVAADNWLLEYRTADPSLLTIWQITNPLDWGHWVQCVSNARWCSQPICYMNHGSGGRI